MAQFVPWSSQPLDEWAKKYAAGKFIDLDGLSMHYIEKGEGDPVILLHGFFYDSFMWNKNMDVLLQILRRQFFGTLLDEIHRLGEMDVPILIVWGRHDKSIPIKRGQEMHNILKGSRLEIFERAGHCPHDEQALKFNQIELDFLS